VFLNVDSIIINLVKYASHVILDVKHAQDLQIMNALFAIMPKMGFIIQVQILVPAWMAMPSILNFKNASVFF